MSLEFYSVLGAGGVLVALAVWYGIRLLARSEVGKERETQRANAAEETNERMSQDNETRKEIYEEVMRLPDGDALKQLRSDFKRPKQ